MTARRTDETPRAAGTSRRLGRALVAVYPPPVRRRWGPELAAELDACGLAGRVDCVLAAVGLWLRPAQWPAPTGSRLRRAVVVLSLVTAGITALAVRGTAAAPGGTHRSVAAVALGVLLAGIAVLVPLPSRRTSVSMIVRAFAAPASVAGALLLGVAALVRRGTPSSASLRVAETGYYWLTLVVLVITPAVALCRADPDRLRIPGTVRASAGLAIVVAGHTAGGAAVLVHPGDVAGTAFGVLQLALAALTLVALVDLRRRRLPSRP